MSDESRRELSLIVDKYAIDCEDEFNFGRMVVETDIIVDKILSDKDILSILKKEGFLD